MEEHRQLVETFGALQQAQAQLQHENDRLRAQVVKETENREAVRACAEHWKEEASRSEVELTRKQAHLERYVAMLALDGDLSGAQDAGSHLSASLLAEANERTTALLRKLELHEEEGRAMRARLEEVAWLHAERERLETELFAARAQESRAKEEYAPLAATAELWKKRLQETRELLGKSEIEARRREAEFQEQISTMSRQLHQCKAQAERLGRLYKQRQERPAPAAQQQQQHEFNPRAWAGSGAFSSAPASHHHPPNPRDYRMHGP